MDNNFGNGQPMPGQAPIGQPIPPMGQPMQGQPMPNQPMPMGQPMPMQPMPPMVKPPKQPMDPAKKKKLIIGILLGAGLVVAGIVAAIVIPILMRVDYSTAYKTAKELKPKLYNIYYSYDCEYVVSYVDSSYTSIKAYGEYIDKCKATYNDGASELVTELGNTDGVKRNNEIKTQYEKFNSEFSKISSGSTEELDAKLSLWQARHNFKVTADNISISKATDAEFKTAANYLIDSGNEALKTYGEGWLSRQLEVAAAYRAYYAASYSNPNYNEIRNNYYNKKNELSDWIAANKPDIKTVAPLNFDDTSKMYSEFTKLYELIAETYEENYNSGSDDCTEFFGEVYCE